MRRKEDLHKIINHYGSMSQVMMLFEEMSELTKAISKYVRKQATANDVAEEIADVQIMLDQMKLIFAVDEKALIKFMSMKIDRTIERMNDEDNSVSEP